MILNYLKKNFFINLIFIFLIFIIDRISKTYIIYLNKKNYDSVIFQSKYLNIDLMWNEGIAFGLLTFNRTDLYNFLTIIISVVILVIFIMVIKNNGLKKYSLIMILGGAIGNLYDRVFFRAVPDFIDFHIGEFHWFVFNIADIFITLGVIFMILLELIDNNNDNKDYEKN
tara:strand:- start:52 stop:561 length:510 start_codon:yes stop_codon:yes gene_type:complete